MEKSFMLNQLFIALIIFVLGLHASHKANAVQRAQTMLLIKRQARDEKGNLIDLNKEPVPESVSSERIVEDHKSTSTDLADSNPSSMQNVKPKPKRIILPPDLSDQEKEVYRNKVKIERQRERRKRMRSSTEDDEYARYLLDNYNKAKKQEVRNRTSRLRRVNDGKASGETQKANFIRRQARDETGKLLDLNKEPSPEVTSVSVVEKSKSTPSQPDHEVVSPFPSKKGKSFKPRLPVILPPGLSKEEKESFRKKVKIERQRERRQIMRSSTDDPYAKVLLERFTKSTKKQIESKSKMLKRVKEGKGSQEDIAKVERKRLRDRAYDRRRKQAKTLFSKKPKLD